MEHFGNIVTATAPNLKSGWRFDSHTVENYPYGFRLKTSMTFSLEFNAKKGFRSISQSVNPKTGKLNKPKKSTYNYLKVLKLSDDGKVTCYNTDFYNNEAKTKGWQFIADNFDLFTADQIKYLAVLNSQLLKADLISKVQYYNSDLEKLKPLYQSAFETLREIHATGKNLWVNISIDWQAVEALKDKDYQPFKITNHS
jgi:hypothetical protein